MREAGKSVKRGFRSLRINLYGILKGFESTGSHRLWRRTREIWASAPQARQLGRYGHPDDFPSPVQGRNPPKVKMAQSLLQKRLRAQKLFDNKNLFWER